MLQLRALTSDLDEVRPSDPVGKDIPYAREAVGLDICFNVRLPNSHAHSGGNFGGNCTE